MLLLFCCDFVGLDCHLDQYFSHGPMTEMVKSVLDRVEERKATESTPNEKPKHEYQVIEKSFYKCKWTMCDRVFADWKEMRTHIFDVHVDGSDSEDGNDEGEVPVEADEQSIEQVNPMNPFEAMNHVEALPDEIHIDQESSHMMSHMIQEHMVIEVVTGGFGEYTRTLDSGEEFMIYRGVHQQINLDQFNTNPDQFNHNSTQSTYSNQTNPLQCQPVSSNLDQFCANLDKSSSNSIQADMNSNSTLEHPKPTLNHPISLSKPITSKRNIRDKKFRTHKDMYLHYCSSGRKECKMMRNRKELLAHLRTYHHINLDQPNSLQSIPLTLDSETLSSQPQQSSEEEIALHCDEDTSLHSPTLSRPSSSQHSVREYKPDEVKLIESSMKRWTWNELEKCWELRKNGQIDGDEENDEVGEECNDGESEDGVDQLNELKKQLRNLRPDNQQQTLQQPQHQRINLDHFNANPDQFNPNSTQSTCSNQTKCKVEVESSMKRWTWNEVEKCWELMMNDQIDGDEGNDETNEKYDDYEAEVEKMDEDDQHLGYDEKLAVDVQVPHDNDCEDRVDQLKVNEDDQHGVNQLNGHRANIECAEAQESHLTRNIQSQLPIHNMPNVQPVISNKSTRTVELRPCPYDWGGCTKTFTNNDHLQKHIEFIHNHHHSSRYQNNNKVNQYVSHFVTESVQISSTLSQSSIKSLPNSNKVDQYVTYLENRLQTQIRKPPLKCDRKSCKMAFAQIIQRHPKTHPVVGPNVCEQCRLCITALSDLNRNSRMYFKKQIKCPWEYCYKAFAQKEDLQVHLEFHNEQLPLRRHSIPSDTTQNGQTNLDLFESLSEQQQRSPQLQTIHKGNIEEEVTLHSNGDSDSSFNSSSILFQLLSQSNYNINSSYDIKEKGKICDDNEEEMNEVVERPVKRIRSEEVDDEERGGVINNDIEDQFEEYDRDDLIKSNYNNENLSLVNGKMDVIGENYVNDINKQQIGNDAKFLMTSDDHDREHGGDQLNGTNIDGTEVKEEKKFQIVPSCQVAVAYKTPTGKYVCEHCDKVFPYLSLFTIHLRTHTGEKPYKCPLDNCNKTFSQKIHMEMHHKSHTRQYPHVCAQCSKSYRTPFDLVIHTRTHTGEKPYKCPLDNCNKTFSKKNIMKLHHMSHTGQYPHVCAQCPKRYRTPFDLTIHNRSHTGERPFECNWKDCGMDFTSNYLLKRHYRTHESTVQHSI